MLNEFSVCLVQFLTLIKTRILTSLLTGAVFAFSGLSARATIVQAGEFTTNSQLNYPATRTDLVDQGASTFLQQNVSNYSAFNGSSTDALNDGALGTASTNPGSAFDLDGSWTSTFILNTSTPSATT